MYRDEEARSQDNTILEQSRTTWQEYHQKRPNQVGFKNVDLTLLFSGRHQYKVHANRKMNFRVMEKRESSIPGVPPLPCENRYCVMELLITRLLNRESLSFSSEIISCGLFNCTNIRPVVLKSKQPLTGISKWQFLAVNVAG
jgi:hypothetical protein